MKSDRSDVTHAVLDEKSRVIKASKIIRIIGEKKRLKNSVLLDIGTGSGYMACEFSKYTKKTYSIDVVDERREKEGYTYKKVKSEKIPYRDKMFDIVISNHVVEHVKNQDLHIKECLRVLKPGGLLYIATPNRLWPFDPHYRILFINWMPHFLGERYLKLLRGKHWDVYPVTKNFIGRKVDNTIIESATLRIIANPTKYNLDTYKKIQPIITHIPRSILRFLDYLLIPTIILLIFKEK